MTKVELPQAFQDLFLAMPESGMGYHLVSAKLKTGAWIDEPLKVLNCQFIELPDGVELSDIAKFAFS